ncbi:MAG TPA: glycosyltransferase family 2 protein [Armatimonadota bacterium]|nr:glycosyltransferase family 2 protein [Armatimonadota bacterium]
MVDETRDVPLPHLDLDLTISIVTWNSHADIGACLGAITPAAGSLTHHVTVVDNDSQDATVAIVQEGYSDVTIIRNDHNAGFGAAHNRAMRAGVGRRHLILNADTLPLPGSLEILSRFFDETPNTAFVGPKILTKRGSVYPSCRSFPTPGALVFRNRFLSALFPNNPYTREYLMGGQSHDRVMRAGWLSGSVLMVSRPALEEIGLLDERFFMYCEDMDWCRRAHDRGWGVFYQPAASVIHIHARSTDQRIPAMIIEHHRSMWKYFCKHERDRRPVVWAIGLAMVLSIRAGALLVLHGLKRLRERLLGEQRVNPG